MTDFFDQHHELLEQAAQAWACREYFSAFPESPSPRVYGEQAAAEGEAAFEALLSKDFPLDQPGVTGRVGAERSPYGRRLDVAYPHSDPDALVEAAVAAMPAWRDAGPDIRAGVGVEILNRLNERSFEIAHAVRHTTGQPFVMAFQAGGPNAQDRGLEAVALAWSESRRHVSHSLWEKPARKGDPVRIENTFTVAPQGVALLIACNTFPTWNAYPGLFASLVTGNPVIVKPHPAAVLPLAITVAVAREVIAEAGFAPDLVSLLAEAPGERVSTEVAIDPRIRIVDFTGSAEFGSWLEDHARQAAVFAEKSGLNTVVLDSTDDYAGLLRNLAFSLSLYSGQMCTTPQNLLVPQGGLDTGEGRRSPAEFAADLGTALDKLLADPARAVGTLGAIVNDGVRARLADASADPVRVAHASETLADPDNPDADVRTPLVVLADAADVDVYGREWFGPISFVISTASTSDSLRILGESVTRRGALTAVVHSRDASVLAAGREVALSSGVQLAENLTGAVFVNQTNAFADYHGCSANPAASATLTDTAFVTTRFHILQSRRPAMSVTTEQAAPL